MFPPLRRQVQINAIDALLAALIDRASSFIEFRQNDSVFRIEFLGVILSFFGQ